MTAREDYLGKEIERQIQGEHPGLMVRVAFPVADWNLVVRALQDAYRSDEFQRINGEKNAQIESLEREVRVLRDKLAHAERRA
jgi:hypothetical protein